jgi:hypothetical protein
MVDYWKDVPGIDGDEILEGYASIHTNPKLEDMLRKVGFDIPKYPKTGDVKFSGKVVGRMDNFNGLMIKSKSALAAIKKAVPKIGIWNEGQALEEAKRGQKPKGAKLINSRLAYVELDDGGTVSVWELKQGKGWQEWWVLSKDEFKREFGKV